MSLSRVKVWAAEVLDATDLNVEFNNILNYLNNGNVTLQNLTVAGTLSTGNQAITSTSNAAFAVGPSGTTNPAFQVDASTASSATGIKVKGAAAGSGVALSVISSGTNEALTMDAKGSGNITIGNTSTGNVLVAASGSNILLVGTATTQTANIVTASNSTNDGISVLADNTASRGVFACRNPNGQVGSIVTSGSATAFNTSSDERLKNLLERQRDFGSIIDSVWVGDTEFKAHPGDPVLSIIAQQIAPLFPDCVTFPERKDKVPLLDENGDQVFEPALDENGGQVLNEEGEPTFRPVFRQQTEEEEQAQIWQAEYGRLGILSLWGTKNLRTRVAVLEARLAALENTAHP